MKSGFLDKLIERLDKLDPESLQSQFLHLVQEKGLLETIFQSIQEGVVVIDAKGKLTYANKAAEEFLGFSLEKARGRPVSRFFHEVDWDGILGLDVGEWSKVVSQEIEVKYPESRFLNFYMVPLSSSEGHQDGVVVILRDVTRDREQEAGELESERLNAVKLLAAGVAHEIGNPLNALNIHLQLLDREMGRIDTEEVGDLKELVDVARKEVSRLDLIITQFLRAIRPSKPKFVVSRIETILKETLTLLKNEIQNRSIDVEIDYHESLPKLRLDRDQIKQAFFNIVRNAFQAMPDGGRLNIALSSSDQFMTIAFRDNGMGIRPENLSRIFQPYHTTKPDGSGLGLMIVQRIIQDHGGRMEIVSKPDVGTALTMFLPLAERRVRLLSTGGEKRPTRRRVRKNG